MNTANVDSLINFLNFGPLLRIGLILILVIYVIFAFFIIRQVVLMGQVLHTKVAPAFKTVAYLHFIASLLVLIFSLLLLSS